MLPSPALPCPTLPYPAQAFRAPLSHHQTLSLMRQDFLGARRVMARSGLSDKAVMWFHHTGLVFSSITCG